MYKEYRFEFYASGLSFEFYLAAKSFGEACDAAFKLCAKEVNRTEENEKKALNGEYLKKITVEGVVTVV